MATFGNNQTTNTSNYTVEDAIRAGYFQMGAADGTADSISVYLTVTVASHKMKCALYDSDGNLVSNGVTEELTVTTRNKTWTTFNFTGTKPTLTANAWYYIAVWSIATGGFATYYYQTSGGSGAYKKSQTYNSFPSSITWDTDDADGNSCIYCTYSVAGEALTKNLSDSTALAETIKFDIGVKPTDSLTMTEALTSQSTFNVNIQDSLSLSELIAHTIQTFLSETLNLSESESVQLFKALTQELSDTLTLGETIKFDMGATISDSLTVGEVLIAAAAYKIALQENITFAEALVAAQTFNLTLADTQTLAESLVAARGLVADLQDTLDLSETLKHDIGVALADTTALAETIAHAIEYNVSLTDTLALSESIAHAIGIYLTETLDLDEDLSVELTAAIRKILKGAMARKIGQPTPINIGIGM